jgi:hypothetical protein
MQLPRTVLAFVALTAVVACDDDDDLFTPQNSAIVQFVNAGSSGTVTGTAASGAVGTALTTGTASSTCVLVSPGSSLGFAENGTSITTSTATVAAGQRYTAILQGSGTSRTMLVVPEVVGTIAAGNYGLRIVNATSQTGNIFVTTPTGTATGTATSTLSAGAATGGNTGVSGFMGTPTANTRVRFFGAASTTTPLADFTVSNATAGTATTVVFANTAAGGVTAFAVPQCEIDD